DAKAAERKAADLAAAAATARQKEDDFARNEADSREKLEKLREQYRDRNAEAKQAGTDIARLVTACRQSYFALPDEFKEKVGPTTPDDWTTVAYPERHELTALHTEAGRIDGVKRKLKDAHDTANKARTVRAKLDSARDRFTATRQGLPATDAAMLR